MKFKLSTLVNIILSVVLLTSMFYVGITSSQGVYDPWCDQDSDGDIDIYDIVPAASAYGTTGDSTKNVNVTNWPVEHALFPENLVLRGTFFSAEGYRRELIDETTPYALSMWGSEYVSATLDTTTKAIYNETFVYEKLPTKAYQILGMPTASMTFNVTHTPFPDYFWFYVVVELRKISLTGEWTYLGEVGEFGSFYNGDKTGHHIKSTFKPPSTFNLTIDAHERLAIHVLVEASTYSIPTADIGLFVCCSKDADDFYVDIPIVKNP